MPEQSPGAAQPSPDSQLWVPLFEDYVDMASELSTLQEFMREAGYKLFEYVRDGLAPDLDVIQDHFHNTNYYVQITAVGRLAAAKFLFDVDPSKVIPHHPFTEEPKKFGLMVSVGNDTSYLGQYLAMQRSNHVRNMRNLREDTGLFDVVDGTDELVKNDLKISDWRKV